MGSAGNALIDDQEIMRSISCGVEPICIFGFLLALSIEINQGPTYLPK